MAYGYEDLSRAQEDVIRVMKAHGNILIKNMGFGHMKIVNFTKIITATFQFFSVAK